MLANFHKTKIIYRHPYTFYLLISYLGQLHLCGYPQVDPPDSPRQIPAENGQVAIFFYIAVPEKSSSMNIFFSYDT